MNEHIKILENLNLNNNYENILDAGTGKSSLTFLTSKFPEKIIDAICFPGDQRKIKSIEENVKNKNYNIIELDLTKNTLTKKYDLVLAHLLLGEATKFGNSFEDLLTSLLKINSKTFIIIDILEDPLVNFNCLEKNVSKNRLSIKNITTIKKEQEETYEDFVAKNYICYIIEKSI